MPSWQTPAIVLKVQDVGEADRLVTFLTPERGPLTGMAKHARKSRRRFANCLESLNRVEFWLSNRARGELEFLEKGELVNAFAELRRDLPRLAAAAVLAELAGELASPPEGASGIFAALELALTRLAAGAAPESLLAAVAAHLLKLGGYGWRLAACLGCGREPAPPIEVSLSRGGVLCRSCQAGSAGPLVQVNPGTLKLLSLAQTLPAEKLTRLLFPPRQLEQSLALLRGFVRHHLHRNLKSWEFFDRTRGRQGKSP
jgi:DNA repair protein RecO (recombination protein O)